MAVTYIDYDATTAGSLANGETTKSVAMGATSAIVSNGALALVAGSDFPGSALELSGTTQGTSGTGYIYKTLTGSNSISIEIPFLYSGTISLGCTLAFLGNGGTKQVIAQINASGQLVITGASATIFTSTMAAGALVSGNKYVLKLSRTAGTGTTDGIMRCAICLQGNETPITGSTGNFSPANSTPNGVNVGTTTTTQFRWGPRASTGTADDFWKFGEPGYDTTTDTLLAQRTSGAVGSPAYANAQAVVDLSGYTTSSGTMTYSATKVSGPTIVWTPVGSILYGTPDATTDSTYNFTITDGGGTGTPVTTPNQLIPHQATTSTNLTAPKTPGAAVPTTVWV